MIHILYCCFSPEITAEFQDDDVDARNRSPAIILWGPCDTTALRDALVVLEMSYAGNPEPRVQWCRAVSLGLTNE